MININKTIKQQPKEGAVRSVKSHQHDCPNVSFTRATPLDMPN